jgi:tRNA pseudouridine38-40 synthase
MANTLIRISYDGTHYGGFQIQLNAPTIQEKLERALTVIYKQPVRITGAGRTDSGVHARGQAANFNAPFSIAIEKLPHAINALLPADIVVTGAALVHDHFHARYDASGKLYSYSIDQAAFPQVMKRLYSWHMPDPLNLERMREAALLFEGTHDFKAYQAAKGQVVDTVRTISRLEIKHFPGLDSLVFEVEGSGFLYHMVRLMIGTLVRVGKENLKLQDIVATLHGANPGAVGPTAPAHGLCLERVDY